MSTNARRELTDSEREFVSKFPVLSNMNSVQVFRQEYFKDIQWTVKPRGTHYAQVNEFEIDVWQVTGGEMQWRWNLLHTDEQRYEACGYAVSLAEAKLTAFGRAMLGCQ